MNTIHVTIAIGLALGLVFTGISRGLAKPAKGPLRVNPTNPRYFTDGTGKAVYLTGSHTWSDFKDMGKTDPPPPFDFEAYLNFLQQYNHNFIRMWTWELSTYTYDGILTYARPFPWQRTGPGKALDGKLKFDLSKFNQAYFDRLRSRVAEAGKRGIYVSIMLFEGHGLHASLAPWCWDGHPFNIHSNINGINGDPDGDGRGLETHTLQIPEVTAIQEAYIRKVIDTVNDLDNVLYEVANESGNYSTEWQYHIIRYIHEYEKHKSKQHPVGMTFQFARAEEHKGSNANLFNSPAEWISPNPEGGYRDNPPAADGKKVIISDTDHLWGIGGNQAWVWKSFCRGLNPIFMDPYREVKKNNAQTEQKTTWTDHLSDVSTIDSRWNPIRKNMGYTRAYANRMNLADMVPRNDLASTKYCLANSGDEYLIYLPDGGNVTVDLSDASGKLAVEWFNPNTGTSTDGETTEGGKHQVFKPPFGGDAVLYLKAESHPVQTGQQKSTPVYPEVNWEKRSPEEVGLSRAKLDAFRDFVGGRGCVVRHGYMVYTWGDVSKRADVASAAKPVYAHFLFKAIEDGKIPSFDEKVNKYEPRLNNLNKNLGYKDRNITWRHLANQISCYGITEAPGTAFDYNDWQMALFWDTLFLKIYGATYENVDEKVLHPLLTNLLQCEDNPTFMAFGIHDRAGRLAISVRDFARFGLLYLHKGNWRGKQLISPEHAVMAVTSSLPNSIPRASGKAAEMIPGQRSIGSRNIPDNQTDHFGSYSWLWWTNGIDREGKRHWPDVPVDAYGAFGHGGPRVMVVIPSLDLVMSWNDANVHSRDKENQALKLLAEAVIVPPSRTVAPTTLPIEGLRIENGWFVHNGRIVWGYAQHNGWWRPGERPNITRNAPGDVRPNRTEDLDKLTDNMLRYGYPGFEHNFGLWYDRRRDRHDTARRSNANVVAPFLEQPWARSGVGKAWDGLTKYDLTRYNPWYFKRVKEFADLCDRKGTILFYNFYMQHALLETDAHYVDFPWRPTNCIQKTGMPDHIPAANVFYDVTDPTRRKLHRAYIRKCLDELGDNTNVVFLCSEEYTGPLSFMQFWLDTISEWEHEKSKHVHVAVSGCKDVLDTILHDPVRAHIVSVVDLRYWWYRTDGSLYAPHSGMQVAGRYACGGKSKETSPQQIYRQVKEYKLKYPNKAIIHAIEASRQQTWAFLMGGGAMLLRYLEYPGGKDPANYISPADCAIVQPTYDFINTNLSTTLQKMKPQNLIKNAPDRNWCLADTNRTTYLVYALKGGQIQIDLSAASGTFNAKWFNPRTGAESDADGGSVNGGALVKFDAPDNNDWVLYLSKGISDFGKR